MTVPVEPSSIGAVVAHSTQLLAAAGIESAANDAELIACWVLGMGRTQLHLQGGTGIDDLARNEIAEKVALRSGRRPLQHILGAIGFREIELAIDARAMVPRPETELLAGAVIEHLENQRAKPADRIRLRGQDAWRPKVLDLCTGSGAVAFSVATEVPCARVWAADLSAEALELARANCSTLGLESRIQLLCGDLYAPIPLELKGQFEVIVANPPYIPTGEISGLDPEVRNFDPRIALDGGEDGLDLTRRILEQAGDWMSGGGLLAMELGPSQCREVETLAGQSGLIPLSPGTDYLGVERFFFAAAPSVDLAELESASELLCDREVMSGADK